MSSSILSPTVNTHLFFCSEPQCSNPVNDYNDTCLECECEASTISECPGCGEDIFVGSNGYCSDCWQERFGVDEEPVSWYKPICKECDSAYASDNDYCDDCANIKNKLKTKMTPDQKADWQRLLNKRKPALSPIRIPDTCPECGDLSDIPTSSVCRACRQMLEESARYCNRCEGYYNLELGDAERRECYDCERHNGYPCFQAGCPNMTTDLGSTCDACRQDWRRCPDCGDMGATVLGSNYCHECYSRRNHPCNAPPAADGWCPECDMYTVVLPNICTKCQEKRDNRCTCNRETGRMCDFCAEEYEEPCRGCGVPSQLWTDDTYCRKCFVERYGDEFPPKAPAIMNPENVCEECGIESLTDCDCKLEEREPRSCCGC